MILMETMGERMASAGLNTLVCICVVFVVLIFISLVISLFGFIPKAQNAIEKKKAAKKENETIATKAIDQTISAIEAKEEEAYMDDLELVAVIAAAIAASSGSSTDDFVVRSIRKVRR